jgi:hypothetical protein
VLKIQTVSVALVAGFLMLGTPALASVTTFSSSTDFAAATSGLTLSAENYGSYSAGQTIANGASLGGLTYTFTPGPAGTLTGGIVTDEFNSFTGLSLGGDQSSGQEYFFGGDSVTITFAHPVTAVGAFFNVNQDSGSYDLSTSVGDLSVGSASYDMSTFVFAGLVSTTPFDSITLSSTDPAIGVFNIPEIAFASVAGGAPEPATWALAIVGFLTTGLMLRLAQRNMVSLTRV